MTGFAKAITKMPTSAFPDFCGSTSRATVTIPVT